MIISPPVHNSCDEAADNIYIQRPTMFKNVFEYYNHLVESGKSDTELDRILPHVHALNQFPPEFASCNAADPSFELDINTARTCGKCNHQSIVTGNSCQSHGCNWNCVSHARSRIPLYNMKFIEIIPEGMQVGIGVTSNPDLKGGIRNNNENAGVYLDSRNFYFGKDESSQEELLLSLASQIGGLPFEYGRYPDSLGLAVDYEQDQLLLKWPNRKGTIRLDLPEKLRGRLLFPLVQAWNGCKLQLKKATNQTENAGIGGLAMFNKQGLEQKTWGGGSDMLLLASLQRKDDELDELRKKLHEESEKAANAKVELVKAQLKLEQLQFNIEMERKDAILSAERSAATLFEEAEHRMMEKHRAMLKQLTKAAAAVGNAAQAFQGGRGVLPSPPSGHQIAEHPTSPQSLLQSASPSIKRLPREISLASDHGDDVTTRAKKSEDVILAFDDGSSTPSTVHIGDDLAWDIVDDDAN